MRRVGADGRHSGRRGAARLAPIFRSAAPAASVRGLAEVRVCPAPFGSGTSGMARHKDPQQRPGSRQSALALSAAPSCVPARSPI